MDQQFATLDQLSVGAVTTFQPSDDELVGVYLYSKVLVSTYKQTFLEIRIYGKDGMPPWEIWRIYQQSRFSHQDFIYFFSPAEKMNPNKARQSRKRRLEYRFEKKENKDEKKEQVASQSDDEHHGAWLMDEFTINQAPDLALCRLKMNEKGGDRKKKSSAVEKSIEEDENLRSKKIKLEPRRSMSEQQQGTSSQQMPSSYLHQDDQVAQVVSENNFPAELEQILMSDDDDENLLLSLSAVLWDDSELSACVAQSIPNEQHPQPEQYSVAPQQQLGPESSSSQEEYEVQLPQQDQASSSHSNEQQQLLADNNIISMIDFDSLDDTCFSPSMDSLLMKISQGLIRGGIWMVISFSFRDL
ncbi:hypothetical protein ACLB2K_040654 [Fragaria x ananassa]